MTLSNDAIIQLIKDLEEKVYLVGGAVRDYILGETTYDKDIIVTSISAKEFAEKFAGQNNATFIELDKENKIYRVVLEDKLNFVDITEPINNSLEEDLKRRDFTINSICIDLSTNEVIDLNNGKKDIQNKIIKSISEENIIDDPLRILRAFRFMSTLGFKIDKTTIEQIKKHIDTIDKPAIERTNYEFLKLFSGNYADKALKLMGEMGLIEKLYPIFNDVKQVTPNTHHHLNLYDHSVETVKQIQDIYNTSSKEVREHLDQVDFGGFSRLTHLKLAGFFHDIGKFSTWTIDEDNIRHRFIKHDDVGAKMAAKIFRKNKFSKKQIEYIAEMIRQHIYPAQVVASPNISEKIYMRYTRKMDINSIDNIILAKADRLSTKGPAITEECINEGIDNLDKLLKYYLSIKDHLKPLPKLLSGTEIMKLKNIEQSPILGKIIKALHTEQMEGNIKTKEEAIDFVIKY